MNTLGGIGAILGTMLLSKMGQGNEEEGAGGPGDGVEVRKFKELSPSTPNAPLDVQGMMAKLAPGAPMTNDNINRVMSSAPKDKATGSFQPLTDAQLTGDPLMQHMERYNDSNVGPKVDIKNRSVQDMYAEERNKPKLPPRPKNVPAARTAQEAYAQSKMYDGVEQDQNVEPSMLQKLIASIMSGPSKSKEEQFTNRGK